MTSPPALDAGAAHTSGTTSGHRPGSGPRSPRWVPGLLLAAAGGAAALLVHAVVPVLSATMVAIGAGLATAALGGVRAAHQPGLHLASRRVLRLGVALLGLQLALGEVVDLGWRVLLVILLVVGAGIGGSLLLARALGVPRETGLLVACGFSICGAAAVAAVQSVRRSRDDAVATAVSLVVVFGSISMLVVPALAGLLHLAPTAAGAWAGASVHEVGQVVVAGGLVGGGALQVAVVVKLGRVLLLAPVLGVLSWRARREDAGRADGSAPARPPLVPAFVVAFAALAALRTGVPLPEPLLTAADDVQSAALAVAMFALGCGVHPSALRRTGARTLALAAGATVLVGLLGLPAALAVR